MLPLKWILTHAQCIVKLLPQQNTLRKFIVKYQINWQTWINLLWLTYISEQEHPTKETIIWNVQGSSVFNTYFVWYCGWFHEYTLPHLPPWFTGVNCVYFPVNELCTNFNDTSYNQEKNVVSAKRCTPTFQQCCSTSFKVNNVVQRSSTETTLLTKP